MHLAFEVAEYLTLHGKKLSLAESCTGGMIAAALTDVAGASTFFECGFVTYSNQSKIDLLGVPHTLIEQYGAVSYECAQAMAEGALKNSNADIALSVTGIAGPDGGSADKPVGLVYIGLARHDHETSVHEFQFFGDRAAIRTQTVQSALKMILDLTI